MSDFHVRQSSLDRALLDPAQHVHFAQGMVLGTDDFNQEFAWLSGRDHWITRDALGYGTFHGLRVAPAQNASVWEVVVGPGAAATPPGKWVRVPREQCADLAAWISAHPEALAGVAASTDGSATTVRLRVTLYYQECLTDPVPVAGDACRTEEDSLQPSRITDDFRLELSVEPAGSPPPGPTPREEEAVRALVAWLRARITVTAAPPGPADLAAFLAELRLAARSPEFPLRSDPVVPVTTPEASDAVASPTPGAYALTPADAERFVREALRVWVVELRPRWHRDRFPLRHGPRPADQTPADEGVLLAVLRVPLARVGTGPWALHPGAALTVTGGGDGNLAFVVDESARPWVLHLRFLQELVLRYMQFLPPPGDTVTSETGWGQSSAAGSAVAYSRADHTHGTPTPSGDVSADEDGSLRVQGLQRRPVADEAPDDGDLLAWRPAGEGGRAWRPLDPGEIPIGGGPGDDVSGTLADPRVVGLQGTPVASTVEIGITEGQVLTYRGGMWQPESPAGAAALLGDVVTDATDAGPRTRVVAIQGRPVEAGNPGAGPNNSDVLTFDGTQWVPRALPAAPPSTDPLAVLRPERTERYQIVAAGLIPVINRALPVLGTSGLKVNERWHTPLNPNDARTGHVLFEFDYDGHEGLFREGQERELAPFYGFAVKLTLMELAEPDTDAVIDDARETGLARLMDSSVLDAWAKWWTTTGSVTTAVEFISARGIVVRVSAMTSNLAVQFRNARLMVEVSWSPDLARTQ